MTKSESVNGADTNINQINQCVVFILTPFSGKCFIFILILQAAILENFKGPLKTENKIVERKAYLYKSKLTEIIIDYSSMWGMLVIDKLKLNTTFLRCSKYVLIQIHFAF